MGLDSPDSQKMFGKTQTILPEDLDDKVMTRQALKTQELMAAMQERHKQRNRFE